MPSKKKKNSNKKEKKPKDNDSLSAVDRTFYEITITDLNNKISRLRAHNTKIEEQNEQLTEKIQKLEEDRTDIVAHLNRQLTQKSDIIKEMNERLIELSKVREFENNDSMEKLKEYDMKYKLMNEQLTSEIKLLKGKLNSLEEFRVQRDDLLAKFDEQETKLKEYTRMHQNTIHNIEQKTIIEKDQLKKDVKNQLYELSKEFNKLTNVRIANYTRQLHKENIILEKEMDKMIRAQIYFEEQYKKLNNRNNDLEKLFINIKTQNNRLIKSCQNQIKIIENLTTKCEQLKDNNIKLKRYKELYENLIKKDICEQFSYHDMNKKLKIMQQRIEMIKNDKKKLIQIHQKCENEIIRLHEILNQIKIIILNAIEKESNKTVNEDDCYDNLQKQKYFRENLLDELKDILITKYFTDNDDKSIIYKLISPSSSTSTSISTSSDSIYRPGIVGLTPKSRKSLLELFKKEAHKIASAKLLSSEIKNLKVPSDRITPSPRIVEENVFDIKSGVVPKKINESHNNVSGDDSKKQKTKKELSKRVSQESDEDDNDDDEFFIDEDENQECFIEEKEEQRINEEDDEFYVQFIY